MSNSLTIPWIILGLLGLGSLAVWSVAIARWRSGQPPLQPREDPPPPLPPAVVAIVVAWVVLRVVMLFVPADDSRPQLLSVSQLQTVAMFEAILIAFLMIPFLKRRDGQSLASYGIHFEQPAMQARNALLLFAATVIPVVALFAASFPLRTLDSEHELLKLLRDEASPAKWFWVIVIAVVIAPLKEELVYRVVLQSWLQRFAQPHEALIFVAVLFAAIHRLPDAIPLLPLALILGYAWQQHRRYLTIVLVHMLFNATNLLLALFSE